MPCHHPIQGRLQRGEVEIAAQQHGPRDGVGAGEGIDLLEEPEPPLGGGEWRDPRTELRDAGGAASRHAFRVEQRVEQLQLLARQNLPGGAVRFVRHAGPIDHGVFTSLRELSNAPGGWAPVIARSLARARAARSTCPGSGWWASRARARPATVVDS